MDVKQFWQETEVSDFYLMLIDPEGWRSAEVRQDGCIHYRRYFNRPLQNRKGLSEDEGDLDYLHICDIDEEIARLQALKSAAQKHFGPNWS